MFRTRTSVRYSGKTPADASYNASLVSMIIFGLSMIFVGFYEINYNLHLMDFGYIAFACSNSVFSLLLFLYAFYAVSRKMVTEGVLYLSVAIVSILISVVEFFADSNLTLMMFFLSVLFFGAALILQYKGETILAIATLIFAIYSFVAKIYPWDYLFIIGSIILICGVAIVLVSCFTMVGIEFGSIRDVKDKVTDISDEEYPEFFENTVGSILLALITFLYVYAVFYNYEVSEAYYILTALVSLITLSAAIYGIHHGVLGQTVLMLLLALSKIIFTIFGFMGLGSTTHIDLMLVLVFIPLAISFYRRGNYTMVLLTIATGLTTVFQTFAGYILLVEGGMAISNVVALYYALTTWYLADTGERLVDNKYIRRIIGGLSIARQ